MRNPEPLAFWTNLGARLLGMDAPEEPDTPPWSEAWADPPVLPPSDGAGMLAGNTLRPRKVWMATWEALSPLGFSRALRLHPWPGIELFLPFHRGRTALLPQGFPDRVPAVERALSVAGRGAAAWKCGYRMIVVVAACDEPVSGILGRAGLSCTTPDQLQELL